MSWSVTTSRNPVRTTTFCTRPTSHQHPSVGRARGESNVGGREGCLGPEQGVPSPVPAHVPPPEAVLRLVPSTRHRCLRLRRKEWAASSSGNKWVAGDFLRGAREE